MPRANLSRKTILTVSEVSQYLRLHRSTVYRMLKKNELPAFRVGSDSRFTVEDLDNWLR
jgi:excisionase family DNA binding protein